LFFFRSVLRIHEVLVRIGIRIHGSLPLTNGSCIFSSVTFQTSKTNKNTWVFFADKFLKVHLHHFSKIKSHKEVTRL
jgi:uncharacterized membrane protein